MTSRRIYSFPKNLLYIRPILTPWLSYTYARFGSIRKQSLIQKGMGSLMLIVTILFFNMPFSTNHCLTRFSMSFFLSVSSVSLWQIVQVIDRDNYHSRS